MKKKVIVCIMLWALMILVWCNNGEALPSCKDIVGVFIGLFVVAPIIIFLLRFLFKWLFHGVLKNPFFGFGIGIGL